MDSEAFKLSSKKKFGMANQTQTSKFISNRYGKKNMERPEQLNISTKKNSLNPIRKKNFQTKA